MMKLLPACCVLLAVALAAQAQATEDLPINMKHWKPGLKGTWVEAGELTVYKVDKDAKTVEVRPRFATQIVISVTVEGGVDGYKVKSRFPNRAVLEIVEVKAGAGALKIKGKGPPSKGAGYSVKAKLISLP